MKSLQVAKQRNPPKFNLPSGRGTSTVHTSSRPYPLTTNVHLLRVCSCVACFPHKLNITSILLGNRINMLLMLVESIAALGCSLTFWRSRLLRALLRADFTVVHSSASRLSTFAFLLEVYFLVPTEIVLGCCCIFSFSTLLECS